MPTSRKILRDAMKAAISANVTGLDGRVTGLRTYARGKDRLPDCEVVSVGSELTRTSADGETRTMHSVAVTIFDSVTADGLVQDRLDDLAEAAYSAMLADSTIQSIVSDNSFQTVDWDFDAPEGGAEQPASITLNCVAMTLS